MSLKICFRDWIKLSHYQSILQQSDKLNKSFSPYKHPQQIGQPFCVPVSMTTHLNWVSLRDPLKIKNLHAHLIFSLIKSVETGRGRRVQKTGDLKINTVVLERKIIPDVDLLITITTSKKN